MMIPRASSSESSSSSTLTTTTTTTTSLPPKSMPMIPSNALLVTTSDKETTTTSQPLGNKKNGAFLSKYQVRLPEAVHAMNSVVEPKGLPSDFEVSPFDVVCGRGKGSYNRPGNRAFRDIVIHHVPTYLEAKSKLDKSMVLSTIVERVREQNQGQTRFVKRRRDGTWYEIGDDLAREKVGHAIREAMSTMDRNHNNNASSSSSNPSIPRKSQKKTKKTKTPVAVPATTAPLLMDGAAHLFLHQQPMHAPFQQQQQQQLSMMPKLSPLGTAPMDAPLFQSKQSNLLSQQQAIFEDLLGARLMTQRAQLEIHQAKNLAQLLGL